MGTQASEPKVVGVVSASSGDQPPGLSPLLGRAELLHVSDQEGLERALARAEILLVVDIHTPLVQDAWHARRELRWVHAASAGVDRLAFPELIDSDVLLTNAAGIFDAAIAEYVVGTVIAFAKDFLSSFSLQQRRIWRHRETERVAGKHMLIVGAGSIGSAIAQRAAALDLRVTGVARTARTQAHFEQVLPYTELDALLPEADYLVLAAPLTQATHHLIDARALQRMKSSAHLINIGRGPLVDTDALVDALKRGKIQGAALDVFEREPLPGDHPLWALPNVLISAHMCGDFHGWREALTAQFIENFDRYVRGEALFNVVDKARMAAPDDRSSPNLD